MYLLFHSFYTILFIHYKVPYTSGHIKKTPTDYNAEITKIEGKIPNISGLATNAPLIAVENKIPDFSNLVKIAEHHTEILEIKSKYFTTAHYNKFTHGKRYLIIKQKQFVNKPDIVRQKQQNHN